MRAKTLLLACVTTAAASAAALVVFAAPAAAAAPSYPLFFRAPFNVSVNGKGIIKVSATVATSAAGSSGLNLAKGTCAWADRKLRSKERCQVIFEFSKNQLARSAVLMPQLTACAHDPGCVLTTHAFMDGRFQLIQDSRKEVRTRPQR